MAMVGGLGRAKPANAAVQSICDQMRREVEQKTGRSFITFRAVQYKTQVVAGTNYFIKVYVGYNEYAHLCVYQPLPYTNEPMSLTAVQLGRTRQDEIKHFEPSKPSSPFLCKV
ncbi:cystatin-B-like [Mixophyes fleayi]|uniref:cystatin-B-like n=1 Tax=Mixophyes fleayi TaxID=3061075 RepID=UPI003F4DAF28